MTSSEPAGIPGNPAGFIRSLLSAGEAPTAGLQIFREAGGRIQDSRWFDLYKSVAQSAANQPNVLGLDPYSLPAPNEYSTMWLGKGGQYLTQVEVTTLDRETGGYLTKMLTYATRDPHTPAEAEDFLMGQFADPDVEDEYGQTAMGAVATDVILTVPYGS